jgi:hypothetical protein
VLHGDAADLRRELIPVLCDVKGVKSGFRYACCGLADQLTQRGEDVFVTPKGCGHKLCPRCGRRRGGKYAKRIIGWLANRPHGDLWMVCLTQPVVKGEPWKAAKKRMEPKVREYMRWLTRRGMKAGMTAVHFVWSSRSEGWHYHVHVLADVPGGVLNKEELLRQWELSSKGEKCRTGDEQCRLVTSAGPAIVALQEDGGDADFWSESASGIAKSVQYPLRDLVQGISATRLGGDSGRMKLCAEELLRDATGAKCFRAWGDWRKACPVEDEEGEDTDGEGEKKPVAPGAPEPLGFVHRVWRDARKGCEASRDAIRKLERSVRNDSEFAKRLVAYCRSALGGNVTIKEGPT